MRWANENKYDTVIADAHSTFPTVPIYVIKAVIAAESSFEPTARRNEPDINDASWGLMQLLLKTARGLGYVGGGTGLFLPATNVYYGVKLLADNYARAGNWPDAISAYNGGFRPELGFGSPIRRAGVRCEGHVVPVGKYCNQKYVDKVLEYAAYFASKEGVSPPALPFQTPQQAGAGVLGVLALGGALLYSLTQER